MTSLKLRLLLVFSAAVSSASATCHPLWYQEGVTVECASPSENEAVSCFSGKLPEGTVASYKCADAYVPLNTNIFGGNLTCTNNKRWIGHHQFAAFSCTINCGISSLVDGNETQTQSQQWPWHASIYSRINTIESFRYVCGGTLVKPYSKGFIILTAAHCVADDNGKSVDVTNLKVVLGENLNLVNFEENGAQKYEVGQIVLHNLYKRLTPGNFQADIAMLTLEPEVKLSTNVLPVCFSGNVDKTSEGTIGEIVKIGHDENGIPAFFRKVSIPVVDPDLCFEWRSRKLLSLEICAGDLEAHSGICKEDGGNGYIFLENTIPTKRYFIQGIVSHGRTDLETEEDTCDSYSVFTKITPYSKWIRDTVENLFFDHERHNYNLLTEPEPIVQPIEKPQTRTAIFDTPSTSALTLTSTLTSTSTLTEFSTSTSSSTSTSTSSSSSTVDPFEIELTSILEENSEVAQNPNPSSNRVTREDISTITTESGTSEPQVRPTPIEIQVEVGSNSNQNSFQSPPIRPQQQVQQNYDQKSLAQHNFYRRMHGAPDLRLDPRLKQKAQAYADKLIREGKFQNENEEGFNKNVYYVTGTNIKPDFAAVSAVDAWYEEIAGYNWDDPYYSTFSQVVWKETQFLGTGVASDRRRTVIVSAYYPVGNILGNNGEFFRENVKPKADVNRK